MLREFTAIVFAALFAMAFSQVPVFVQEYTQRLGGAVGELQALKDGFDENARRSDLTLEAYIQRHQANTDPVMRRTGRTMETTLTRLDDLSAGQAAITAASPWTRPFVLAQHNDRKLLLATWDTFRFTLTVDIYYGLVGLLVGFLFNAALVRALRRKPKAKRVKA
ncbi:MAG: DUF2937 family protein [Rhodobacterales bacterium]|nr:DUF2937 family protein [Rhodobacterales bacterium]